MIDSGIFTFGNYIVNTASCNHKHCNSFYMKNALNCSKNAFNCGQISDQIVKDLKQSNVTRVNHDEVNHPSHYTNGKIESIDIIADVTGEHFEGFLVGNCLKYLHRYRSKNGVTDLKKCRWYLDKLIEVLENE